MTITVYSNQRRLLSVNLEEGTARVWQGSMERVKEIRDDKTNELLWTETMGGIGGAELTLPLRQVMTRKEHRELNSFRKFKQVYDREVIPVLKEEIKAKMIKRFGTMDYNILQSRLFIEAQSDTRLYIKTKGGNTIKTTLSEQAQYIAERNAGMTGNYRNE